MDTWLYRWSNHGKWHQGLGWLHPVRAEAIPLPLVWKEGWWWDSVSRGKSTPSTHALASHAVTSSVFINIFFLYDFAWYVVVRFSPLICCSKSFVWCSVGVFQHNIEWHWMNVSNNHELYVMLIACVADTKWFWIWSPRFSMVAETVAINRSLHSETFFIVKYSLHLCPACA